MESNKSRKIIDNSLNSEELIEYEKKYAANK